MLALSLQLHVGMKQDTTILRQKALRFGHVALVLTVMLVLALLIVPLPPAFLDTVLALNIALALMVLLAAISVTDPIALSTFPTLLLIATLFRLGLNINSTRLILAEQKAGRIIETFGSFVIGDSVAVGMLVFLVLLIIQFIVVSKGAERVAEVSARFSLDGLPGKQMSIDADLRAGLIDSNEAAKQRQVLLTESKMYGSMDGAMKFVKGDTIAGFVITIINLIGGMFIGFYEQGQDFSWTIQNVSKLTIGDGLVSQIPALLISLAAGILVTRVTDGDESTALGDAIHKQIFGDHRAMFAVAVIAMLLACVPGFPAVLFLAIAMTSILYGLHLYFKKKRAFEETRSVARHVLDEDDGESSFAARPFVLELNARMYGQFLSDVRWQHCLNHLFPKMKRHLSREMGVPLPELKIVIDHDLDDNRYQVRVFEIAVDQGFLSPEHCVIRNQDPVTVPELAVDDMKSTETVHGSKILLFPIESQKKLLTHGHKVVAPEEMLLLHLGRVLKLRAKDFIGIQEVRTILNGLERDYPELIKEVVPRLISIQKLTEVVKRLVEESISIKDFRLILEILASSQPDTKSVFDLTEILRCGMARVITDQYSKNGVVTALAIDPHLEDEILSHVRVTESGNFLAISPKRTEQLIATVHAGYERHKLAHHNAILITKPETRRYLRIALASALPAVAVVSYQELDEKILLDVRDTISLHDINFTDQDVANKKTRTMGGL